MQLVVAHTHKSLTTRPIGSGSGGSSAYFEERSILERALPCYHQLTIVVIENVTLRAIETGDIFP